MQIVGRARPPRLNRKVLFLVTESESFYSWLTKLSGVQSSNSSFDDLDDLSGLFSSVIFLNQFQGIK